MSFFVANETEEEAKYLAGKELLKGIIYYRIGTPLLKESVEPHPGSLGPGTCHQDPRA